MSSILFAVSTTDGHTDKIARYLSSQLEAEGHTCDIRALQEIKQADLACYQALILGASVRYGKHQPDVAPFMTTLQQVFNDRPTAFFSVCAVARKPGKDDPKVNPYVRKLFRRVSWQPDLQAVFAGKIDYPRYKFFDKLMIRFIMWMGKGPTAPDSCTVFTDWQKVDGFAAQIAQRLSAQASTSAS